MSPKCKHFNAEKNPSETPSKYYHHSKYYHSLDRSTNIQIWQSYTISVQLKYQTALEIIWNNQRLCVKETKSKVWLSTVRMTSYMSFQTWINRINDKTTAGEANSWSAVLHWESIDAATMPCCLNWALIIWFFDFHSSICA